MPAIFRWSFESISPLHEFRNRTWDEAGLSGTWAEAGSNFGAIAAREAVIGLVTGGAGEPALLNSGRVLTTGVRVGAQSLVWAGRAYTGVEGARSLGTGAWQIYNDPQDLSGYANVAFGAIDLIGLKASFGKPTPLGGGVVDDAADLAAHRAARTNAELVEDIATRAQRWARRKQLTGTARQIGTRQHTYARELLRRYQRMFGDRGLKTEVSYLHEREVRYGLKGSVRTDVFDPVTGEIWDYKFGTTPMSQRQIERLLEHVEDAKSVIPIYRP